MYKQIVKPLLFCFKPETSEILFLHLARLSRALFGPHTIRLFYKYDSPSLHRELFGLDFKNPVGLAAGFDCNGEFYNEMADFGFSFIEIGSLSPSPHSGAGKPRVFRIRKDKALINRVGTRNKGVKNAIMHIDQKHPSTILAASLVPDVQSHKDEELIKDYQTAFSLMYDFADMFTINISVPNESGILRIEDTTSLADVLDPILDLRLCYDVYKPILIKVSPDIPYEQLDGMLDYCMLAGVDGIIAGGGTRKRNGLTCKDRKLKSIGQGCLSGAPLFTSSLELVKHISEHTKGRFPIIGCGGIMSPAQAEEMINAGASLVQMHTGILFEGPKLVKKTLKHLAGK